MTSLQSKLLLVTFALCILGLALITIRLEAPHWFSVNQAFGGHDSDHVTPHLWIPNTIAKNVLDGDPIIICSSDYPNATQQGRHTLELSHQFLCDCRPLCFLAC